MEKDGGFTIIEVSLFLAISATLILLTVGLSALVSRQRFQDTMATLRTTIQSEYEEVRSGINTRLGGATGVSGCTNSVSTMSGNSNCLVIGKLLQFTIGKSEIKVSYLVANKESITSGNDFEAIKSLSPLLRIDSTAADAGARQQQKTIEWGGEFAGAYSFGAAASSGLRSATKLCQKDLTCNIAVVRSPISSAILVMTLDGNSSTATISPDHKKVTIGDNAKINSNVAILIKNSNAGFKSGAVCLYPGANSTSVKNVIPADNFIANLNASIASSATVQPWGIKNPDGLKKDTGLCTGDV